MAFKIIHTGDWHLGKKLFKVSRLEEQSHFLNWLIEVIIQEQVHAILVCGDIFDSPRPSDQALRLYFEFLEQFKTKTQAKLYIISGNHDSGQFLEAPNPLIDSKRIEVYGGLNPEEKNLPLSTLEHPSGEKVDITFLPYFRSIDLDMYAKNHLNPETENTSLQVLEKLLECRTNSDHKQILMAHHLFGSFQPAGSEQGLHLTGLDTIPLHFLKQRFDYVALGHIHKAQNVQNKNPTIRYAGSPLAFRFSENRNKSLTLITVPSLDYSEIEIPSFRSLKDISAQEHNLEAIIQEQLKCVQTPYDLNELWDLKIHLTTPSSGLADLARSLIEKYPVEIVHFQTVFQAEQLSDESTQNQQNLTGLTTEKLFELYYESKFPDQKEMPDELRQEFLRLLQLMREQRENPAYQNH